MASHDTVSPVLRPDSQHGAICITRQCWLHVLASPVTQRGTNGPAITLCCSQKRLWHYSGGT